MARILHEGEWYDQLSTEALYESEYERILLANAEALFPAYVLVPFKMAVESESDKAKADFALVHRKYRDWWVVEAEMSHHSFENHVRPQVRTLSQAVYNDAVAQYLVDQDPRLDLGRMRSVIRGQQPRILVIVNSAVATWSGELRRYNAIVTVLEIFRSRYNDHLYRLNGEQPIDCPVVSSECNVELARFLRVLSPGILPVRHGEQMSIFFKDGLTEWCRLDLQDRVYLSNNKPVSLNPRATYELVERENHGFELLEKL